MFCKCVKIDSTRDIRVISEADFLEIFDFFGVISSAAANKHSFIYSPSKKDFIFGNN